MKKKTPSTSNNRVHYSNTKCLYNDIKCMWRKKEFKNPDSSIAYNPMNVPKVKCKLIIYLSAIVSYI